MTDSNKKLSEQAAENNSYAVVLAGGDGLPRRKLIPQKARFGAPAQFLRTAGRDYLINETRRQIAAVFPPERILFVVTENHARYYEPILKDVSPENLIVQPQNDGTTFAVLYAALRLAKMISTAATAAFFPADLRVGDPQKFMSRVETAVVAVRRQPNLILLGSEPKNSEGEWIEPDSTFINEDSEVRGVRGFYDFVLPERARELKAAGGLLFSSVMVGTAATFLRKIRRATPDIYARFAPAKSRLGTPDEIAAMRSVFYSNYADTDFSRDVLTKSADKLAVINISN